MPYVNYLRSSRPNPAAMLVEAMSAAKQGSLPPTFTTESFLSAMGLQGEKPDGQTLMDRLISRRNSVNNYRLIVSAIKGARTLFELTNTYQANPAQEGLAYCLGQLVNRQLEREGNVCPTVQAMASASTRSDIISDETRSWLDTPPPPPPRQCYTLPCAD